MLSLLQWPDGLVILMSDLIPPAMTSHPTGPGEIPGQIRHSFALIPAFYLGLWAVPFVSEQGEEASRRHPTFH